MLALLEYFWDAWPAGEPPPPPPESATAVTSGGSGPHRVFPDGYVPALEPRIGEDFWEVRKEYLKRLREESEEIVSHEELVGKLAGLAEGIPEATAVAEIVAERERAYRAASVASTRKELQAQAAKITALTMQLVAQRTRDEEDILLILLLLS